ncbi:hypothetical protein SteCoe_29463 [Stentor coeruleus]|uniref:Uncharacterized protein n=1 Tax=Stentor coeruleus TaxID=5963 RepID=A0A1R2B5V7_9CILI|nr:hypothetical protein SteCoe_29463 [Stentor coeruleus]
MSKNPSKSSSVQKDFVKYNKEQASQAKSKNFSKSIDQKIRQPASLSISKSTLSSFNTAKINQQKKKQEPPAKFIPTTVIESFQILNSPKPIQNQDKPPIETFHEKYEKVITPVKSSLTLKEQLYNPELSLEKFQGMLVQKSGSSKKSKSIEEEKTKDDEDENTNYKNTAKESQEINDIYNTLDEKAVENYKKSISENIIFQLQSIEEDTGSSKYYSPEASPKFNEEAGEDYMEVENDDKNLQLKTEKHSSVIHKYENICSFGNPETKFIQNDVDDEQNKLLDDEKKEEEMGKEHRFGKVWEDHGREIAKNDIEDGKDSRRSLGNADKEEIKDVRMEGYDEEVIGENYDVNANEKITYAGIPEISEHHIQTYPDSNFVRASIKDNLASIRRKSETHHEKSPKKQSLSPAFKMVEKTFGSQTVTNIDNIEKNPEINLSHEILKNSTRTKVFQTTEANEKFDKIKEPENEMLNSQRSSKYSMSNENKGSVSNKTSEALSYPLKSEKIPTKSNQDSQENRNLTEANNKTTQEIQNTLQSKSKKASIKSIPEENPSKSISNKKSVCATDDNKSESESEEQEKKKIEKNNKQVKENEQKKTSKPKLENNIIEDQRIQDASIEDNIISSSTESFASEKSDENDSEGYENAPKPEAKKYMTRKMSKLLKNDQGKRKKSKIKEKGKKMANSKKEMMEKEKEKLAPPKVFYEDVEDSETSNIRRSERLAKIKQLKEKRESEMQFAKRRPRSKKAGYRKRLKE